MDLWDEFEFLEGESEEYKSNSLYGWCMDNPEKGEQILKEWDYEKNLDAHGNSISPKEVMRGSGKKVWWKCYRCGNSYQIPIRSRVGYVTGCRKCRTKGTSYSEQFLYYGLKQHFSDIESRCKVGEENIEFDIVIPSINTYIEYSGEFWHTHYSKIDEVKREYCKEHSIRFIEIWEMKKFVPLTVENDIIRYKYNDSKQDETLYEVLLKLFGLLGCNNPVLNYNKIIRETTDRMLRPVHNSISENYKELVAEWDVDLNNGAKPEFFSGGSSKRITWTCTKCAERWKVTISSRVQFKTGCPYCGYNVFDGKVHRGMCGFRKRVEVHFGKNNL